MPTGGVLFQAKDGTRPPIPAALCSGVRKFPERLEIEPHSFERYMMTIRDVGADNIVLDEIVPAGRPWGRVIKKDEVLRIIDLEGQQAVDFLCYDAANPGDRYNAMNTIKVQRHVRITRGTVLYSDSGAALFTVTDDTLGWHDTIYGCCSDANNFLRY